MKNRIVLITGSRSINIKEYVWSILRKEIREGDFIIQGGAKGVDELTLDWCNGKDSENKVKISGWQTFRPIKNNRDYLLHRNAEMVGNCDLIIAIWDGKSRGTKFTIDYANARVKPVRIYNLNEKADVCK